jgi:hypothetical protein
MVYDTLRITEFLDYIHSAIFEETQKNTTFRKLDLLPPSGECCETPTLLGPLERDNLKHQSEPLQLQLYRYISHTLS